MSNTGADATATAGSAGMECRGSALPPPMCHEEVEIPSGDWVAIDRPGDRWMALVRDAGSVLEVFDPETSTTVSLPTADSIQRLSFADFDGDGWDDIVWGTTLTIPVYKMPELTSLGEIPWEGDDWANHHPAEPLDVDHNGTPEIVASGNDVFETWRRTAQNQWEHVSDIPLDMCLQEEPHQADLDGDGFHEVLLRGGINCDRPGGEYDPQYDVVTVLSGAPGATQPSMRQFPLGLVANRFTVGDFNGDGIPDLLARSERNDANLLYGDGNGGLGEPAATSFSDLVSDTVGVSRLEAGDFDDDGADELIISRSGLGDSGFVLLEQVDTGPLEFVDFNVRRLVLDVADVNRDGVPDVVFGSSMLLSVAR